MIYFDNEKQAYAFEIPEYICTLEDEVWTEYAGTDKWDIIDGEFTDITDTPEYIAKKEAQEKERIGNLKCTKRVFVLLLEELGLDYFEQIEPAIAANRQARLEWELCVELERKNPLIDQLAAQFDVTPEQIDYLFKYANGEITVEEFREIANESEAE